MDMVAAFLLGALFMLVCGLGGLALGIGSAELAMWVWRLWQGPEVK